MKKKFNYFIIFVSMVFSFFICTDYVSANTIKDIYMDVFIDKNGNAIITETWEANLTQGTEGYRVYKNLGGSEIINFSVSDGTGTLFETLSKWNINASFSDKAYKCGYNKITNGVELCWGISKYGDNTYTLKYTITNLVSQYTDYQGIYTNFLNLSQSVDNAKIKIYSDYNFSVENSKIWAFGNNGSIVFEDGAIILESNGYLNSSQYMVALVKFESNFFTTLKNENKTFDEVYKEAIEDVDKSELNIKDNSTNNNNNNDEFILFLLLPLIIILFIIVGTLTTILLLLFKGTDWVFGSSKPATKMTFGEGGLKLPNNKTIDYFREIPCDKDLVKAYWVANTYEAIGNSTLQKGIIGAFLLKWIRDKKITVIETKRRFYNFKDNNYAIDFNNMSRPSVVVEAELYDILIEAAKSNKILEANEMKKWCKKNCYKLSSWFDSINKYGESAYIEEGLIVKETEMVNGMFGSKRKAETKIVNPKLKEEAIHLKGLKKYLNDFSLMHEKKYFEVHLWEDYLIFAHLFGIAKKVEKQFKKLYPEFREMSAFDSDITIQTINIFVSTSYEGYTSGMSSGSSTSYDSFSSGGGGGSFSSGGSSSGGSSGGGFR